MRTLMSLLALLTLAFGFSAQASNDHPFPQAKEGKVRHMIWLKPLKNERRHKIELQVGKQITVDCNQHFYQGHWKRKT